jgi:N-carbamoylputrescine amidase
MLVGDAGWNGLVDRCESAEPDILLLNEMPFGPWISVGQKRDSEILKTSQQQHREGMKRLNELGTYAVLGTYPLCEASLSINQAFVWTPLARLAAVHTKQFFPDEGGFFEARWFDRGKKRFEVKNAGGLGVGFLICTDVMFNEWARHYGRNGAHLIAVPRTTPVGSEERWKTMCSAAAIVSGCYVASSNRAGIDESGLEFAGKGWIFGPSGQMIVETSPEEPVVCAELDLSLVQKAQGEYPCYVEEIPTES